MSKLQVDDIVNKDDTGSAGFSRGAVVTGIATATSFSGALTGNVTGNVSGSSGSCTGNAATATNATNLANGANITTGTIADARLGTVSSSKLSGALPALDGSALTNLNIPAGFSELDAALFN